MKINYEIQDNFLPDKQFETLQNILLSNKFNWNFQEYVDFEFEEGIDTFQFTHIFYGEKGGFSPNFEIISPILDILDPLKLNRIKANLITITPKIVKNQFHVDFGSFVARHVSENMKKWTTSIFYVNTNDGYTEFEDGTIVESVANRFVKFPANIGHRGTSCTDEKIRVVINFNYQ